MKSADIKACVEVNPLAEFAAVPGKHDTRAVRIRGLVHLGGSAWSIAQATDVNTGEWMPTYGEPLPRIGAGQVTSVEAAERVTAERRARHVEQQAQYRRADAAAKRMTDLGLTVRRVGLCIRIEPDNALDRALDTLRRAELPR